MKKVRRRVASLSRFQPFTRTLSLVMAKRALFPIHAPLQGMGKQSSALAEQKDQQVSRKLMDGSRVVVTARMHGNDEH